MKRQTAVLPFFDVAIDRSAFGITREPSREQYQQIQPDLPRRQQVVLSELRAYLATGRPAPTAYELFQYMRDRHTAVDLNDVRPRITELHQASPAQVQPMGKRRCQVSGATAMTWTPVEE